MKISPTLYNQFLNDVKNRVNIAQRTGLHNINEEYVLLFYDIGSFIQKAEETYNWKTFFVIDQLSIDLRKTFPLIKGLYVRSLQYMQRFATDFEDVHFIKTVAINLPWSTHMFLIQKVPNIHARMYYATQAVQNKWTRNQLKKHIEENSYYLAEEMIHIPQLALPHCTSHHSPLALKSNLALDFLNIEDSAKERDLELALIQNLDKFLPLLGPDFSYIGRQKHLRLGEQSFFLDLLFYHIKLRCYVVIELKDKELKPEHISKLSLYMSAVDAQFKSPNDNPTKGILMCKTINKTVAAQCLKKTISPISFITYQLSTTEQIELN